MRIVVLAVVAAGVASFATPGPAASPSECADGRDNDRDGLVDWRHDGGCSDRADASESTPLRCDLEQEVREKRVSISGTCTGPFAAVEVKPAAGGALVPPSDASHSLGCATRAARVLCTMRDASRNPDHVVRVTVTVTNPAQPVRVRVLERVPGLVSGGASTAHGADVLLILEAPKTFYTQPFFNKWWVLRVVVSNNGPAPTRGGRVLLRFSRGFGPSTSMRSRMGCAFPTATTIECRVPRLGARGQTFAQFHLRPTTPGDLVVTGMVTADGDPNRKNNRARVRAEMKAPIADVAASVLAPPTARFQFGQDYAVVPLTLRVLSSGPSETEGARMRVTFNKNVRPPLHPNFPKHTQCEFLPREWVCTSSIVNGHDRLIEVIAAAIVEEEGLLEIAVDARGSFPDPKGENNVATARVQVTK